MCNGKCTCPVKCNPCKCEMKSKCIPETDKCDCPSKKKKIPKVVRAIGIVAGMALSPHILALVLLSDAIQVKKVRLGYNKIIDETNEVLKKVR